MITDFDLVTSDNRLLRCITHYQREWCRPPLSKSSPSPYTSFGDAKVVRRVPLSAFARSSGLQIFRHGRVTTKVLLDLVAVCHLFFTPTPCHPSFRRQPPPPVCCLARLALSPCGSAPLGKFRAHPDSGELSGVIAGPDWRFLTHATGLLPSTSKPPFLELTNALLLHFPLSCFYQAPARLGLPAVTDSLYTSSTCLLVEIIDAVGGRQPGSRSSYLGYPIRVHVVIRDRCTRRSPLHQHLANRTSVAPVIQLS